MSLSPPPGRFLRFAAPLVLAALGVAWPVLDLLGNNAEFFLARGSGRFEIAIVLGILGVIIPIVAGLIGLALGLIPGRVGRILWVMWVFLLATVLSFLIIRRLPLPVGIPEAFAMILGLATVVALGRFEGARSMVRYLSVAPAVLVGFFVLATPSGGIITDTGTPVDSAVTPTKPAPVVLIVFDEFPVTSLIDPSGNLRADRYPNFARLAAEGIWYRNAMTVQQQTEHSVPAILTGINPPQSREPYAGQYPGSIFTALAGSYDMDIHEVITRLCPITVCQTQPDPDITGGIASLAKDLGVIAGHVLLPKWATANLPLIDRNWGDFGAASANFNAITAFNRARKTDPRLALENLAREIANTDPNDNRPDLFFAHVLLPHNPWQFLPTGQRYPLDAERLPGSESTGWGDNEWLSAQALQRHLLQVGYVDYALGKVIDAMKESGIFDQALMIVVADHGIALRTNIVHWRRITDDTVGDIAAIPLFVKPPGGGGGRIDDRRSLTVDIMPTVAEVLGFDLPWATDGISLLGPDPQRTETTTTGPQGSVTFGVDGHEKLEVAARQAVWFPNGDPYELAPRGAPDLVGQPIQALAAAGGTSPYRIRIDKPDWYLDVDPNGDTVPARIVGTITGMGSEDIDLAVAVNGTITAVVRSFHDRGKTGFQAMVPSGVFVPGRNRIEVAPLA